MNTTLSLMTLGGTRAFIIGGDVPAKMELVFGAVLHSKLRRWVFPAYRPVHLLVTQDLLKVAPWIRFDAQVRDYLAELQEVVQVPAEHAFRTVPFQHQRDGLEWLLNRPRGGLFYSPGLGKCKITVDLQSITKDPLLILCPRVVLRTWAREFVTHGGNHDVIVVEGSPKEKLKLIHQARERAPSALVITYESSVRLTGELLGVGYRGIVADESHRIKGPQSIRTQAALQLSEKAPRRVLLSGTPSLGSPLSLYPQLRFLGKCFAPEKWIDFKKKFAHFPAEELRQGKAQRITGFKNLDLLNDRTMSVCIRRTQEECLDLPPQHIIDIPFEVSREQKLAYNQLVEDQADTAGIEVKYGVIDGGLSIHNGPTLPRAYAWAPEPVSLVNKLEQVSGGFLNTTTDNPGLCNGCPKLHACVQAGIRPYTRKCEVAKKRSVIPHRYTSNARRDACLDLLTDLLEDDSNKVIIWTRYIQELAIVKEIAEELGVGFVTVQGGMSTDAFEKAMKDFNEDPSIRLYIGQVASGIGVTLNAANYMVYYSLPWSHEHYVQSLGRNYRIGQKRACTVYRLIGEHTLDIAKAGALDQKIEIEDLLIGSDNEISCEKHGGFRDPNARCTCDGTVMKIIAKMKMIP